MDAADLEGVVEVDAALLEVRTMRLSSINCASVLPAIHAKLMRVSFCNINFGWSLTSKLYANYVVFNPTGGLGARGGRGGGRGGAGGGRGFGGRGGGRGAPRGGRGGRGGMSGARGGAKVIVVCSLCPAQRC